MHDEETVFSKDLFYMSKCIFGNSEDFFFNSSKIPKCVLRLKTIKIIWF